MLIRNTFIIVSQAKVSPDKPTNSANCVHFVASGSIIIH